MSLSCINVKSKEFLDLQKESGLYTHELEFMVARWQEINNQLDIFPNLSQLQPEVFYSKVTNSSEAIIASEKTIRDLAARMSNFDLFQNADNSSPFEKLTYSEQQKLTKKIKDISEKQGDRIGIRNYDDRYNEAQEYKKNSLYLYKIINNKDEKYKGVTRVSDGIIYINLAYATLDTPIHEILGHPIIRAIKTRGKDNSSTEVKQVGNRFQVKYINNEGFSVRSEFYNTKEEADDYAKTLEVKGNPELYNNLVKELETGRGKEVLDRIKRDYVYKAPIDFDTTEIKDGEPTSTKEYSKVLEYAKKEGFFNEDPFSIGDFTQEKIFSIEGETYKTTVYKDGSSSISKLPKYTLEEQQEEALVELLGLMTAEKLDNVKDGKLISLLKRLLKEMKQFIRSLINQKEVEIDKLPDNMTLGDLSDLLAYSNSKLILPGNEVIYTTPDNEKFKTYQEASNHISELAKNVKDVDLNNININPNLEKEIKEKREKLDKELLNIENKLTEANNKLNNFEKEIRDSFGDTPRMFTKEELDNFKELKEKLNIGFLNKELNRVHKLINEIRLEEGMFGSSGKTILNFIQKNKEYEQSKEIIEEWKKVNNIQYNPEEIYSRGQEFSSVVGAYSSFDVNLMMQNLLSHIEDNEKAGGKFAISAYTKPIDKQIGHLEGGGGKIKFKLYPQSNDILWAANTDVYSGSVWDASEKVNKDKKSELLGVSYTKYPSLQHINSV